MYCTYLIKRNILIEINYRKDRFFVAVLAKSFLIKKNLFHLITTLRCSNFDQDSQPNTHPHTQPTQHPTHAHPPRKRGKRKKEKRRREGKGPAPHHTPHHNTSTHNPNSYHAPHP